MTATYPNGDKRTVHACPHCGLYIFGDHYVLSAHIVAFHANQRFVMDTHRAVLDRHAPTTGETP